MNFVLVGGAALIASLLTFFSGFGLGTVLMPVFALFFPVEVAIALTAIVHFLNNIFKFTLIGGKTNKEVFIKFGLAAIPAAFLGAYLLVKLSGWQKTWDLSLMDIQLSIQPVKAIIGIVMIFFALFEILPKMRNISFERNKLWIGGLISGFFGGLSGHQGAMRSAFLIKTGLTKEGFIATGITISLIVDVVRTSIYASSYFSEQLIKHTLLLLVAIGSAFIGAVIGRILLKKVTYNSIRLLVGIFLIIIGAGLAIGVI